jgi:hypothetical protein
VQMDLSSSIARSKTCPLWSKHWRTTATFQCVVDSLAIERRPVPGSRIRSVESNYEALWWLFEACYLGNYESLSVTTSSLEEHYSIAFLLDETSGKKQM